MRTILILLAIVFIPTFSFPQYFWELKQPGQSVGGPIDVEMYNPGNVYYGSDSIIYKSTDGGETFTPLGIPAPNSSAIMNIIINDENPSEFLIAVRNSNNNFNKILKTTNSGNTWNISADSLTFSYFGIPMTPDPSHPDTVYTMSADSLMFTTDFGNTWASITDSVGCSLPCDIEVFPDTSIILVGDNGTGIFKSVDYGQTWENVYNTTGEIPTITVDYNNAGVVWAAKWGGGGSLLKSTDYGSTWQVLSFFESLDMWGIHIDPNNSNYIVAGKFLGGVMYITHDGGNTWKSAATGSRNYQVYIVDSMNVYAAQGNGLWKLNSTTFIPVELISFTASIVNNKVSLNWTTATEINNLGFDIEISYDKQLYKKIGFVRGFGTSSEKHNYTYSFNESLSSSAYFRLKQIDLDGSFEYSSVVEVDALNSSEFILAQNYPNPFNPTTKIGFQIANLPSGKQGFGFASLKVYDVLGREVATLVNEEKPAGEYEVGFDASHLSSGIYFYKLIADNFSSIKKMILIK
jgi:hypothetical protein